MALIDHIVQTLIPDDYLCLIWFDLIRWVNNAAYVHFVELLISKSLSAITNSIRRKAFYHRTVKITQIEYSFGSFISCADNFIAVIELYGQM